LGSIALSVPGAARQRTAKYKKKRMFAYNPEFWTTTYLDEPFIRVLLKIDPSLLYLLL